MIPQKQQYSGHKSMWSSVTLGKVTNHEPRPARPCSLELDWENVKIKYSNTNNKIELLIKL